LPHHPSVLRALKKIVTLPTNMAKMFAFAETWPTRLNFSPCVGCGLRHFSFGRALFAKCTNIWPQVSLSEAQTLTNEILKQGKVTRTAQLLDESLKSMTDSVFLKWRNRCLAAFYPLVLFLLLV